MVVGEVQGCVADLDHAERPYVVGGYRPSRSAKNTAEACLSLAFTMVWLSEILMLVLRSVSMVQRESSRGASVDGRAPPEAHLNAARGGEVRVGSCHG